MNQTSLNLPVDMMLLSLVIVAVSQFDRGLFFSLVALLCFSSSIYSKKKKKSQQKKSQKKKTKLWTKKGTNSVCGSTFTFNCTRGRFCSTPLPDDSSPDTEEEVGEQGRLLFCKNVEIRCLHNLCGPSCLGPPQVQSGKYCF